MVVIRNVYAARLVIPLRKVGITIASSGLAESPREVMHSSTLRSDYVILSGFSVL